LEREVKKKQNCEKSNQEAKVRIALECHIIIIIIIIIMSAITIWENTPNSNTDASTKTSNDPFQV